MFKKLSNLLFEEEEIDEEVSLDESEPIQVEPSNIRKPNKRVEKDTVNIDPKPSMQRIDVQPSRETSTPAATTNTQESVFARPTPIQPVQQKPITAEAVQPEKPKSLGITVDEITPASVKPAQIRKKPAKPQRKEETRSSASVYEFRPVISPMFGVDEKDMDAVQTTAKMIKSNENDESMSKIISPIYGQNVEAQPTKIQDTVEKSNTVEDLTVHEESLKAEDDIPAFSLDDILNARDEEYKRENDIDDDLDFENEEVLDETVVLDPFTDEIKKERE